MRLPNADWSRWLLASAIAVAAIAAVLVLFRAPEVPRQAPPKPAAAAVTLAPESDPLLTEEAMLRDPTPLFLPTRWNAAENALPAEARREPGSSFRDYRPAWKFAETELRLALPPAVSVPPGPVEALAADRAVRPLIGFGPVDRGVASLPPRGAFVQVWSAAEGQVVFARALEDVRPPGEPVWQPLEFLIAVDPTGMLRPAVLTESSRVAAVDRYFQDYLAKGLHLGERLPPGFYRVSIGP